MNEYSRALTSARIAIGASQSALRSGEPLSEQLQEAIDAGLEGLSLLSNWPAQSSSPCEIQELNNDGVPTGVVWCRAHDREVVSMYEVIHGWLAANNPGALELCPYKKVARGTVSLQPAQGCGCGIDHGHYEARLVAIFEEMAAHDGVSVAEIVGEFILGYFASQIERAEGS